MSRQAVVELPEPPAGATHVRLAWSGSRRVESFALRDARAGLCFTVQEPAWLDASRGRDTLLLATWLADDGGEIAIDGLERGVGG